MKKCKLNKKYMLPLVICSLNIVAMSYSSLVAHASLFGGAFKPSRSPHTTSCWVKSDILELIDTGVYENSRNVPLRRQDLLNRVSNLEPPASAPSRVLESLKGTRLDRGFKVGNISEVLESTKVRRSGLALDSSKAKKISVSNVDLRRGAYESSGAKSKRPLTSYEPDYDRGTLLFEGRDDNFPVSRLDRISKIDLSTSTIDLSGSNGMTHQVKIGDGEVSTKTFNDKGNLMASSRRNNKGLRSTWYVDDVIRQQKTMDNDEVTTEKFNGQGKLVSKEKYFLSKSVANLLDQ